MPTIAPHAHSPTEDSAFEILFDSDLLNYPDPDIIVRSSDLRELPLRKLYIVESSPVLRELIQAGPSCAVDTEPSSDLESVKMLPIVQLPDRADILSSLFSFVFPVPADLPPKLEQVVELLSVAQKYKMDVVLGRIRSHISIERPTLISKGNALLAFGLARKYGLRQEALQAARLTLGTRITLRDLETKLNSLPGTSFYEIWRYHQKVRQTLEAALRLFASSSVCLDFVRGSCAQGPEQQIPNWLRDYFNSITAHYTQALQVDPIEFHVARAHHVSGYGPLLGFVTNVNREKCLDCARVADGAVRTFCTALAAIIDGSILRVGSLNRARFA
ncbi:hypothetical protein BC834DRAFT_270899 [Gloeopeniophorella convolvens]|nr:hypothetical protein BC834DRAFT_270899 [Gloeopeniophorella convolvens]